MQFTAAGPKPSANLQSPYPLLLWLLPHNFNLKTILTFWQSTSEATTAWLLAAWPKSARDTWIISPGICRGPQGRRRGFILEGAKANSWLGIPRVPAILDLRSVPVHEITAALDVYGIFGNNRFTELRQQLEEEHELKTLPQRRRYRVYREAERRKKLQRKKRKAS